MRDRWPYYCLLTVQLLICRGGREQCCRKFWSRKSGKVILRLYHNHIIASMGTKVNDFL